MLRLVSLCVVFCFKQWQVTGTIDMLMCDAILNVQAQHGQQDTTVNKLNGITLKWVHGSMEQRWICPICILCRTWRWHYLLNPLPQGKAVLFCCVIFWNDAMRFIMFATKLSFMSVWVDAREGQDLCWWYSLESVVNETEHHESYAAGKLFSCTRIGIT